MIKKVLCTLGKHKWFSTQTVNLGVTKQARACACCVRVDTLSDYTMKWSKVQ